MHLHFEEHRVISRNGVPTPLGSEASGRQLQRRRDSRWSHSEEVVIYRKSRYVHGKVRGALHNMAHEDHNMMFGFEVLP
jgi:hypothetical protein